MHKFFLAARAPQKRSQIALFLNCCNACHENYLRLCRFLLERQCDRVAQTFEAMHQVSSEVVLVELV